MTPRTRGALFVAWLWFASMVQSGAAVFYPAQIWPDTQGRHINAHCGDILRVGDTFYWFGEIENGNHHQVNCYASKDLQNWRFDNVALKNLGSEKGFIERPKVIYNGRTKQFVMWMHKEEGSDYSQARAAVAVSDNVDGDYRFLGSFRPLGEMSRDDYLFQDDDGTAYFVSSSNGNADMKIYRLTSDYLRIDSLAATVFAGQYREAPVLFKRGGIYYLLTSMCTGIEPSPQYYSMATSLSGPWSENRLLCSRRTWNSYYGQGAFELTVAGSRATNYIYALDRWVQPMRHMWLPLEFNPDGTLQPLEWRDSWGLDVVTGVATLPPVTAPTENDLARGKRVTATYNSPGEMVGYHHFANHEPGLAVDGNPRTYWSPKDNLPHWLEVNLQKPTHINAVAFSFWHEGSNAYRIECSSDGEHWLTLVQTNSNPGAAKVRQVFPERTAQYVRVWLLGSNVGYNWPGIGELAVYSHRVNVARGKRATADDFQACTDASKAVDGDYATAWSIDTHHLPQSITVDLAQPTHFSAVRVLWEAAGVAHQYLIETSADGAAWQVRVDQRDNTNAVSQPEHRINEVDARFVRITLTGYDHMGGNPGEGMHPWPGIREIEVLP